MVNGKGDKNIHEEKVDQADVLDAEHDGGPAKDRFQKPGLGRPAANSTNPVKMLTKMRMRMPV